MDEKLMSLFDEKIEHLKRYEEMTARIMYEDIDRVGDIISERQEIVDAVKELSARIDSAMAEEERITPKLYEKMDEMSALSQVIMQKEKAAVNRLENAREEIYAELTSHAKTKKVVGYFGATAVDINKGSKINKAY